MGGGFPTIDNPQGRVRLGPAFVYIDALAPLTGSNNYRSPLILPPFRIAHQIPRKEHPPGTPLLNPRVQTLSQPKIQPAHLEDHYRNTYFTFIKVVRSLSMKMSIFKKIIGGIILSSLLLAQRSGPGSAT